MKKLLKKIGLFFKKIGVMLRNETPRFFRNLFKALSIVAGMAIAGYPLLLEFASELAAYKIDPPRWLSFAITYVGFFAAGAAFVSKLVVKYEQLSRTEKETLDKT